MSGLPRVLKPDPPLMPREFAIILSRKGDDKLKFKAYAVYLASQGMSLNDVAKLLGKSVETIRSWIKAWNDKGIEGLREAKKGEEDRN